MQEFLTHSGVSRILNEGGGGVGGGGLFCLPHPLFQKPHLLFDRSASGFRDQVYPDWVWPSNVVLY